MERWRDGERDGEMEREIERWREIESESEARFELLNTRNKILLNAMLANKLESW
jgi:hypothetical protein